MLIDSNSNIQNYALLSFVIVTCVITCIACYSIINLLLFILLILIQFLKMWYGLNILLISKTFVK